MARQDPRTLRSTVERLIHEARYDEALLAARRLLALTPGDEHAIVLAATAEISASRPSQARARLERALRTNPDSPRLTRTLASALRLEGRPDEALAAFQRALELAPDDPVTRCALAEMHLLTGDPDAAMQTIDPLVAAGHWDMNSAIIYARICLALRCERDALEPVERVLQTPNLPVSARAELLFRLGELRDRLKLYDSAFAAFREANRTLRVYHDPSATSRAIDEAIAHWTREALDAMPRNAIDASRVVLIVGMPRSGTSLVEQILSSHPDAFGADERGFLTQLAIELDPPAPGQIPIIRSPEKVRRQTMQRAARRYLKMLDDLASGQSRISDKMPVNFLHLGLVERMLPGARVIHCTRDPMDTCLSCFFQGFSPSLSFAFDLEHLGRFYRDYRRLMEHWEHTLDLPILTIPYEQMVEDQEQMTRSMLDFVGLPFDEACLRFHESERVQMTSSNEQVRRPIYRTSVRRHEHYAPHLEPLRRALAGV